MKISTAVLLFLGLVAGPIRAFAGGGADFGKPAEMKEKVEVKDLSPEEEQEYFTNKLDEMSRKMQLSDLEIANYRGKFEALPTEQRSRMIEIMSEIDQRRDMIKSNPNLRGSLGPEIFALRQQMWSLNPGFMMQTMGHVHNPFDRRDSFQAGAEAYPKNAPIRRNYADSLLKSGDNQQAARVSREAINLDPRNPQGYSTLADAQLKLGDAEGALATARAGYSVTRSPTLLSQVKLLETSANRSGSSAGSNPPAPDREDPPPDNAALRPAPFTMTELKASPAPLSPPAPGMIAIEQGERSRKYAAEAAQRLKGGAVDEALRLTAKSIEENPSNANAYTIQAAAHIRAGQWREARRDIEAAYKLAPANANILALYSKVLTHDKEYDAALQMADEAIRQEPRMADAHYYKALALTGLRRYGDAKESLHEAALLSPEQYQKTYEWALQLPSEDGLAALLGETPPQTAAAPSKRTNARFLGVGVASLVGGFLVALGLLQTLSGGWVSRVKTRITGRRSVKPLSKPVEAQPGTMLGGVYQIRKKIGLGGMGVVYEATDMSLERRVAIKKMREELRTDPREAARFLQEARMVAQLHHPNIVDIYAVVEDHGDIYLVFEFVDGITVHHIIEQRKRMAFGDIAAILRGTCSALDYAHGRNIIHRDLKPANIMLNRERVVKVMDFGVARQAKDSLARLSMTNTVVGTPPYMAPEQEQGAVCRETDVFALGVMVYEMATGDVPFAGAGAGMLLCKMNKTYAPASRIAPGLPPGFDEFMARALEPDPAKRIRTPGEFYRQLEALAKPT